MTEYKDLQDKAKSLGLKYVGVSQEDLQKSIDEAEATPNSSSDVAAVVTDDEEMTPPDEADDESEETVPKALKRKVVGCSVVLNNREVRRYSKEDHGKEFKKLAEEFAEKKGATVVELFE